MPKSAVRACLDCRDEHGDLDLDAVETLAQEIKYRAFSGDDDFLQKISQFAAAYVCGIMDDAQRDS